MKDYIFYRNLKKSDIINEMKQFYKSNFEMRDFYLQLDKGCLSFSGIVQADPKKTVEYADIMIEGQITPKTISWVETDWEKTYEQSSEHLVRKIQNRLASAITQHYKIRGYKTLEDFDTSKSKLSL